MASKKRKSIFDFDPFEDMEEMIKRIQEEFDEIERQMMEMAKKGGGEVKTYGPYVYGFSITMGPDGKPIIEEFGNIKRMGNKPLISEEREPIADVIEKDDEIRVVAELPGVDKNNIKVNVDGNTLTIQAQSEDKKYYKEIELPAPVDENSAKATYKNGVLEVVLKKVKKSSGKEIKVE